ncbi:hypothetical protein SAMN05216302_1001242 [Nitrosomonas aestuarii]|uniref:Uncharacterized protein n=1 Tax=Nitrosomonas aestuarii TaxID=52441 RepID=A0A1I3XDS9_9PROT|nr:hypothetical protein [Nitrosomonas aestuarii]SFK17644.1 hypothetical protein SAMN05216302_1001242 [Nitrosomonas aestuarii]
MQPLVNQLTTQSDREAVQLLQLLAQSDIDYPQQAQVLTGVAEPILNVQQQAGLARATLAALAEQDPQQAETMQVLLNSAAPQRFDGGTAVFTLAAVVWLLRTHIRIKRNENGQWTVLIENKPPKNSSFDQLIEKIKEIFEQTS